MANYAEKLKDPRWQKRRLYVFERDKWACVTCGSTTNNLQVHHKKYTGEPWEAPDCDLETICDICHKKEHGLWKEEKRIESTVHISEVFQLPKYYGFPTVPEGDHREGKIAAVRALIDEKDELQETLRDNSMPEDVMFNTLIKIKDLNYRIVSSRKEIYG